MRLPLRMWHHESRFVRRDDRLGPVTQPEFAQYATHVCLDGLLVDNKPCRYFGVGKTLGDQS